MVTPPSAEARERSGRGRELPRPLGWFAGRVTGREGHPGVLIPIGWATYNAVWLAVEGGLDANRRGGVGVTWPIWLYSGAIALTVLFAFFVVVARWRHPLGVSRRAVSLRGEAGLCGALGIMFAGLAVIFGSWWVPFAGALVVMAAWLAVRDARDRRRRA